MPQEQSNVKDRSRLKIEEPRKYTVVFHNDDFTPMAFVVAVLMGIFQLDYAKANHLMMDVHTKGKARVGSYSYDVAMTKAGRVTSTARLHRYPLKVTVEPQS